MQDNTLGNLVRLMKLCGLEIERFNMEKRVTQTYHEISHSFKDEIIVPTIAITNTMDFFLYGSAKKTVKTADGTTCVVQGYEEKHICELEEDIKRLYNVDAWSFINKWYKYDSMMTSMVFIRIWLSKDEDTTNE